MKKTLLIIKNSGRLLKPLLLEDDKIFSQDIKVAVELKLCFSNVIKIWKIPEQTEANPLAEEIKNPILKSVIKYEKHPSVTAIGNLNIRSHFEFSFVSVVGALKEIKKLNPHKDAESTNVPMLIYCRLYLGIF